MTEHESSRTLVKSAPELWAECSDAASLARHLGAFGEIRITKLEPESAVAWEGAAASGTVTLEPSGWGTRVTLTVTEEEAVVLEEAAVLKPEIVEQAIAEPPPSEPEPEPEPAQEAETEVAEAPPRVGWLGRLRLRLRGRPVELAEPAGEELEPAPTSEAAVIQPEPEPERDPEPVAEQPEPVAEQPELVAEQPELVAEQPELVAEQPELVAEPEPETATASEPGGEDALVAALDSLGRAHHRPYSRA
jgi:hypothetical protein